MDCLLRKYMLASNIEEQSDYFNKLPDELVLKIFRRLSKNDMRRCSEVCRRWHQISYDKEVDIWYPVSLFDNTISLAHLLEVIQRGAEKIQLFRVTIVDPVDNKNLFFYNHRTNLKELVFDCPKVSQESLAVILENLTHLVRLDIVECLVNQRICAAIGKNSELEVLILYGCSGMNISDISTILKGCKKIEVLNLRYTGLDFGTIEHMIVPIDRCMLRIY